MKKIYTVVLLAGAVTLSAAAQSKFDGASRAIAYQYQMMQEGKILTPIPDVVERAGFSVADFGRAGNRVFVTVTLQPGYTAADLEARGFDIDTDMDDIVIAQGTMDDILALENCDFVKALEFPRMLTAKLDASRVATGVDMVHNGTSLHRAFTGKGVITGIFDTGVDPNHALFRKEDGTTRISRLWIFNATSERASEYATDAAIKGYTTDNKNDYHGTHTSGCMFGYYNGKGGKVAYINESGNAKTSSTVNNPYYGMAIESDIVMSACQVLPSTIITKAVKKITDYAKSQGQPAVINLSLGSNIGPHDGSSALGRALEKEGEYSIICISSGNEGDAIVSIDKTFTSSDKTLKTFFTNNTGSHIHNDKYGDYLEFWSDSEKEFSITPILYNTATKQIVWDGWDASASAGEQTNIVAIGQNAGLANHHVDVFTNTYSGDSYIQVITSKNKGTNNRYSATVSVKLTRKVGKNVVLGFRVTGSAGQRIMATYSPFDDKDQAYFKSLNVDGFQGGSSDFSINDMACGKNVIAVGSWNARMAYPILGQSSFSATLARYDESLYNKQSEVSSFSSFGRTYNGTSLPHVCAPGIGIVSGMSKYYKDEFVKSNSSLSAVQTVNGRENHWIGAQGTSMACPIVAGSLALWLEADPTLTCDEIISIIKKTSTVDDFVKAGNSVRWGAGKFNALAGIKEVIAQGGVNDVTAEANDKFVLTPIADNAWEIYVPRATDVNAALYNISGQLVKSASASGSELDFSADGLAKGIYVLNINGSLSTRIVVR